MLKQGKPEDIRNMFIRMRKETRDLLNEVVQLVYFMRGSIQYDDMLMRTPGEREIIADFIKSRLEQENEKMYPVY
jgi:hypothetical protein